MGGEKRASPIPLILVLDHPNSYPTLCIRKQLNEFQLSLILSHTVVSIPGDLLSVGRQKTTTTVPALNSKPVKWACLRREESCLESSNSLSLLLPTLPILAGWEFRKHRGLPGYLIQAWTQPLGCRKTTDTTLSYQHER